MKYCSSEEQGLTWIRRIVVFATVAVLGLCVWSAIAEHRAKWQSVDPALAAAKAKL